VCRRERLADTATTAAEARDAAKNVGKWTRRKYRLLELSQLPGRGWVEYEPYGTVLIIGAWNFPFALRETRWRSSPLRSRRRRHG
jgi:aldehyde dehydrogenase (NAD+)